MSSYEYNQLLKFLYFEGYADSYAEAEELLESMSDDEFDDLLEKHSFPLKPSERRSVENIGRMLRGDYSVPPGGSVRSRSAKKAEPEPQEQQPKPRKRTTDLTKVRMREEFDDLTERMRDEPSEAEQFRQSDMIARNPRVKAEREAAAKKAAQAAQQKLSQQGLKRKDGTPVFEEVVEYLFVEGFADTIENAEIMAENISEDWVDEILNEKTIKASGEVADRRAHTTDPTVRPIRRKPTPEKYKHSEAEFDSTLTSPSARRRKEERRQGTGGFNV
jgi:hypothetical protein